MVDESAELERIPALRIENVIAIGEDILLAQKGSASIRSERRESANNDPADWLAGN